MSDHVRICSLKRCAYCRLDVSSAYSLLQRDVRDAFFARQIRELDAQAAPPGGDYVRGVKGGEMDQDVRPCHTDMQQDQHLVL